MKWAVKIGDEVLKRTTTNPKTDKFSILLPSSPHHQNLLHFTCTTPSPLDISFSSRTQKEKKEEKIKFARKWLHLNKEYQAKISPLLFFSCYCSLFFSKNLERLILWFRIIAEESITNNGSDCVDSVGNRFERVGRSSFGQISDGF